MRPGMTAATSDSLAYLWHAPGNRLSVSVGLAMVGRLQPLITDVCQSLSWRALEVGGLLLGRKHRRPGATLVEIHDFEPIRCEHAFGASYLLSPSDRAALEQRIRWHKAHGRFEVVGLYRSHTRHDFAATAEDVHLISAHFSEPWNVFLLIHFVRGTTPTAGFVVWENRKIRSKVPYETFPFTLDALARRASPRESRTTPSASVGQTRVALTRSLSLPQSSRAKAAARLFLNTLAIRTQSHLVATGLALRTSAMQARRLAATEWPRLQRARLSLPRIRLSARQLAIPAALLLAVSTGVVFRHVASGSGSLRDTANRPIRAALPKPPSAAPLTPSAALPELPGPATSAAPPAVTPKPTVAHAHRSTVKPSMANRELLPRIETATISPPPRLEAPSPPDVSPENKEDLSELVSWENIILAPDLPRAPDPFVTVTVNAEQRPDRGSVLHKLLGKRHIREDFIPARVLHQVSPDVSVAMRHQLKDELPVNVRLYLDSTGKVKYAELLSDGTGKNRDFATLAVFSSRHWQFAPARIGNDAVPAVVVLRFRFGREQD